MRPRKRLGYEVNFLSTAGDLWGEKVEHVKREPRNDRKATYLRLLPTFASALQEKTRTCASFTKILANYISEESLITADYHKNII
ncbi:unnamed protein product [Pocillopora meandrina]|uniref:Uncharacterized protein n=1 Tax=Pocillopora meandrina TaxID=46732 RepID=A0AAU9W283_9CNID|nr:unnamed protein product [Pocillopora meandrina]